MRRLKWIAVGVLALVLGFLVYAQVGAFFARESHAPSPFRAKTIPIDQVPGRENYRAGDR
jgi:hypothetical protein